MHPFKQGREDKIREQILDQYGFLVPIVDSTQYFYIFVIKFDPVTYVSAAVNMMRSSSNKATK
jgi:hypothetical protein